MRKKITQFKAGIGKRIVFADLRKSRASVGSVSDPHSLNPDPDLAKNLNPNHYLKFFLITS